MAKMKEAVEIDMASTLTPAILQSETRYLVRGLDASAKGVLYGREDIGVWLTM